MSTGRETALFLKFRAAPFGAKSAVKFDEKISKLIPQITTDD